MWSDPEVFGAFLLVRRIAESAMAGVYLAVRLGDASGRAVVLKRPALGERASGRAAQAILREAEVLSEVRGAGIPALEAAGDIAGLPYVALERLRGASLAKILALGEPVPVAAVRALGADVARALARLHAAGWVHRDVAPSNLFADDAGEAYLLDFGLCARPGASDASVLGTRGYAAPEAATPGEARAAQDVYSLAVCLAEAALGRRLFDETSLVEAAARGDAPPAAAALEPSLPGITAALRRDPAARPSAADFAAALSQRPSGAHDGAATTTLAALAQQADAAAPVAAPRAITPTISMPPVAPRDGSVLPTLRESPAPEPVRAAPPQASIKPGASARSASVPSAPARLRAAAILVVVALTIGFVSGRLSARDRRTSMSIGGPVPRRVELMLDDRKLTAAEGVPMQVSAGPHTVTFTWPKGVSREVTFTARPGEHVVILPPRNSASPDGAPSPDDGAR